MSNVNNWNILRKTITVSSHICIYYLRVDRKCDLVENRIWFAGGVSVMSRSTAKILPFYL